ncbi:hypothetical protein Z946_1307 [Sulfitobacter noctilucicola]|nr:hypothetical protein Z946_1307 [Sulfitobacter noctilucicola]
MRPKYGWVSFFNGGVIAHLLFYAVLILVPILLLLVCVFVLPAIYTIMWVRTFDRIGGKRTLTLMADMSVVFVLAWMITPPKVYYKPAGRPGDAIAAIAEMHKAGQYEQLPQVLDWWWILWGLITEPPVMLYVVVLGGLWVLRKTSTGAEVRNS